MYTFSNLTKTNLVFGDFAIRRNYTVSREDIQVAQMSVQQLSDMNAAIGNNMLSVSYAADPKSLVGSPLPLVPFTTLVNSGGGSP